MSEKLKRNIGEYLIITMSTIVLVLGVYLFKFPNNFSFGGVTGIAVIIGEISTLSPGVITFIINMILLGVGFIFLGRDFGIKTIYVSILTSVGLWAMEYIIPMSGPLTNDPLLELVFATLLPSFGTAILFNIGASSGGTDIIAMIVRKYTSFNIGTALLVSDLLICLASFFVFDVKTGLLSFLGLMLKSLVVDSVIESVNLCKYFNVICDNPEPICQFITKELRRSATVAYAEGAYSGKKKAIIFTALKRSQAVLLRNYVKEVEPSAFILISNTSEIIGNGFHDII